VVEQSEQLQDAIHLVNDEDGEEQKTSTFTASKGKQKATISTPAPGSSPKPEIPPSILSTHALSTYTCPICFCPPTNATMTPCGHVACGSCLFMAVKSGMRREGIDRCPVCRAEIRGWDGKGGGVTGLVMQ
ncbi:hypothetical protein EV361DRAFT_777489, partial [Lentinula raphanica]